MLKFINMKADLKKLAKFLLEKFPDYQIIYDNEWGSILVEFDSLSPHVVVGEDLQMYFDFPEDGLPPLSVVKLGEVASMLLKYE